jgi:hypothetical protein
MRPQAGQFTDLQYLIAYCSASGQASIYTRCRRFDMRNVSTTSRHLVS